MTSVYVAEQALRKLVVLERVDIHPAEPGDVEGLEGLSGLDDRVVHHLVIFLVVGGFPIIASSVVNGVAQERSSIRSTPIATGSARHRDVASS